ncbi:hypothetical protein P7K49_040160, partial [Saguinus oedipus]
TSRGAGLSSVGDMEERDMISAMKSATSIGEGDKTGLGAEGSSPGVVVQVGEH